MFVKMLIKLEEWELNIILDQFDPTGKKRDIDIESLQTSFEEWQTEKKEKDFDKKTGGKYKDSGDEKGFVDTDSSGGEQDQ